MTYVPDTENHYIMCDQCGNQFHDGIITESQASGCACTIQDCKVITGFGSHKFDMTDIELLPSAPVNDGEICDDCLENLVNQGHAVVVGKF